MPEFPLSGQRESFRAAAIVFIPELATATAERWQALEEIIGRALAARPASLNRRLRLFLAVLNLVSFFGTGRSLRSTTTERATRMLHRLERSRAPLLRRGVWGLRTLVFMGYYTQPAITEALGYRAAPAGWDARR